MISRALLAFTSLCNVTVVLVGSITSSDWVTTSISLAVINIFIGASFGLGFDIGTNTDEQKLMHVGVQHAVTAIIGLSIAVVYGVMLSVDPIIFFYGFGVYLGAICQQILIAQSEIYKALIIQFVCLFLVTVVLVCVGLNPSLTVFHFILIISAIYFIMFRHQRFKVEHKIRTALFSRVSLISLIFTYIDRLIYQKLGVDQIYYVTSDWIGRPSILQSISRAYLGNSVSTYICKKVAKCRWCIVIGVALLTVMSLYLDSWLIGIVPLMLGFALNRMLSDYALFDAIAYLPSLAMFLIGILFIASIILAIFFNSLWTGIVCTFFLKWITEFLYLTWVTNRGVKVGNQQ